MLFETVVLTLRVAIVATLLNLPLALALSWLVVKKRVRGAFILEVLASLPLAVPPVVVGYMLLLLMGRRGPIGSLIESSLGLEIAFTWIAAVLASAVVSFPLVARAVMTAMEEVDERLERSARTLGAGTVRVALTITLPLAYRGILAGVLLGFIRALSEFGATIIVAGNIPGKTQTIPLAIYDNIQLGRGEDTMSFVLVALALALATLAVHNWLLKRSRGRRA
ncbi:MAG: molybdate ABC transporter permease subunit [Dehalococcoidia bacterium]|nr:molybdate ABC transporter permease subunit [Dehalococcoidia bacterium]